MARLPPDSREDRADRPLRILYVPPRYYPYVGGVEELCRGYADEMQRRGHLVTICCATDGPSLPIVNGIPVLRSHTIAKLANTNLTPALPLHLLAHTARSDIVHTYLPTPWSADWAAWVGRLRRLPVVLSYANDIVGQGNAAAVATAFNHLVLPTTLRCVTRLLVLSTRYIHGSPHLRPFSGKIEVLPPGVDTVRFSPDGTARWPATFFFLGLLDEYHRYKGLDVLLKALALLRESVDEVKLIVGGRGSLLAEYRDLAHTLGLRNMVDFRGYIDQPELLDLYRRCTAFVLPSTSAAQEGFGLVAVEAMACGAPVVVSDVVGMAPEIERAGAGLVVPPGNAAGLANALHTLATTPGSAYGANGRTLVVEQFSWPVVGDRLERLYRTLVAVSGPR